MLAPLSEIQLPGNKTLKSCLHLHVVLQVLIFTVLNSSSQKWCMLQLACSYVCLLCLLCLCAYVYCKLCEFQCMYLWSIYVTRVMTRVNHVDTRVRTRGNAWMTRDIMCYVFSGFRTCVFANMILYEYCCDMYLEA